LQVEAVRNRATRKALVALGVDFTGHYTNAIRSLDWEVVMALQVERRAPSHSYAKDQNGELTRKAVAELAFKIINILNGVSVGEAQYVLDETKCWLLDSHVVDTSNQRFAAKVAEAQKLTA